MNHSILRNTPSTLELLVYTSGNLTDLDADPTVVVTDGNNTVVSSGVVSHPGSGTYHSVLPAQANLSVLTAVWTGLLSAQPVTFTQTYEIVGNLLFTEAEARLEPIVGQQSALADEAKYSDARIAHWRSVIGDMFEWRLRRAVTLRYCRVVIAGSAGPLDLTYGHPRLASGVNLNRPGRAWDITRIISASVGGTAQTVGDLEIVGSKLYHTSSSWSGSSTSDPLNVTIEYEYGPDPVESEAHQRALELLLANAAPSGFPSTATSFSNEDGTFRITTFPAGVEDFLKHHTHRRAFGIA